MIPLSANLSDQQIEQLSEFDFRRGTPFVLSEEGIQSPDLMNKSTCTLFNPCHLNKDSFKLTKICNIDISEDDVMGGGSEPTFSYVPSFSFSLSPIVSKLSVQIILCGENFGSEEVINVGEGICKVQEKVFVDGEGGMWDLKNQMSVNDHEFHFNGKSLQNPPNNKITDKSSTMDDDERQQNQGYDINEIDIKEGDLLDLSFGVYYDDIEDDLEEEELNNKSSNLNSENLESKSTPSSSSIGDSQPPQENKTSKVRRDYHILPTLTQITESSLSSCSIYPLSVILTSWSQLSEQNKRNGKKKEQNEEDDEEEDDDHINNDDEKKKKKRRYQLEGKELSVYSLSLSTTTTSHEVKMDVKCENQQVQIDHQVFKIQDIFGLPQSIKKKSLVVAGGKDEIEEDDDSNRCVICMDEPSNVLILPCRHLCLCEDCSRSLISNQNKCPICRESE